MIEIQPTLICCHCDSVVESNGTEFKCHCARDRNAIQLKSVVCQHCLGTLFINRVGEVFCANPTCESIILKKISKFFNEYFISYNGRNVIKFFYRPKRKEVTDIKLFMKCLMIQVDIGNKVIQFVNDVARRIK